MAQVMRSTGAERPRRKMLQRLRRELRRMLADEAGLLTVAPGGLENGPVRDGASAGCPSLAVQPPVQPEEAPGLDPRPDSSPMVPQETRTMQDLPPSIDLLEEVLSAPLWPARTDADSGADFEFGAPGLIDDVDLFGEDCPLDLGLDLLHEPPRSAAPSPAALAPPAKRAA